MNHFRLLISALAWLISMSLAYGNPMASSSASPQKGTLTVLGYSEEITLPFNFFYIREEAKTDWQTLVKEGSPLKVSTRLFVLMSSYRKTHNLGTKADIAVGLDILVNHWPDTTRSEKLLRWNYNHSFEDHAYKTHPPGWWSGMDSFLIPVVFLGAFEIFQDKHWLDLARRSMDSALLPPNEGGSLWRSPEGCWISEYSWPEINNSEEFYVLNGHLFGLQALKIFANAVKEKKYEEVFQCALQGTESRAERFSIPGWSRYMLHKPEIAPPHYVIYELSQFRALWRMTGIEFFKKEMKRRQALLQEQYAAFVTDSGEVILSRIGAPHPYMFDIYPSKLTCSLKDGTAWSLMSGDKSYSWNEQGFFISGRPSLWPTLCSLSAIIHGKDLPLYQDAPINIAAGIAKRYQYQISASKNARSAIGQGPITVSVTASEKNAAKISLSGEFDINSKELFGIELSTGRKTPIGVTLIDEHRSEVFRYYPALEKGGNTFILLSKLGFLGSENLSNKVKRIVIWLYTDKQNMPDQSDFSVNVGQILSFANPAQLRAYLEKSEFKIPEGQ
ncbi:MAG: D-glucuronyl C5-epimerase family protein [Azoarcus sp.]|jgi:hypothetical protein|nr:D-glucuronyl C5-epimerase family protein [Azoarcus sp.]